MCDHPIKRSRTIKPFNVLVVTDVLQYGEFGCCRLDAHAYSCQCSSLVIMIGVHEGVPTEWAAWLVWLMPHYDSKDDVIANPVN